MVVLFFKLFTFEVRILATALFNHRAPVQSLPGHANCLELKRQNGIQVLVMLFFFMYSCTYNAHDELVRGVITAHQQRVVDDEVAGQEVGVAVDGGTQDGFAVGPDVERVIVHQLEQVLVQQHHLAALLTLLRLHVPVPQRTF